MSECVGLPLELNNTFLKDNIFKKILLVPLLKIYLMYLKLILSVQFFLDLLLFRSKAL